MRAREFIFEAKLKDELMGTAIGLAIVAIASAAIELFCFEEFGMGADEMVRDAVHNLKDNLNSTTDLSSVPAASPIRDEPRVSDQPMPPRDIPHVIPIEQPPANFIPKITGDPMLDHTLYHAAQGEDQDFTTRNAQWVANLLHNDNARPLFDAAHNAGLKGKEFLAFIAQCATESWDFTRFDENGNQRHLNQLYAHVNGNGNESSGDGYRYRGRGYIQLTGKGNYDAAGKAVGEDLVNNPDRAAEPSIAAKIATWFWEHRVHGKVSDYGNTREVTQAIQGGTGDLKARRVRFNLLKQFMKLGDHLNKVLHQQQHKEPEVYVGDEDNTTH